MVSDGERWWALVGVGGRWGQGRHDGWLWWQGRHDAAVGRAHAKCAMAFMTTYLADLVEQALHVPERHHGLRLEQVRDDGRAALAPPQPPPPAAAPAAAAAAPGATVIANDRERALRAQAGRRLRHARLRPQHLPLQRRPRRIIPPRRLRRPQRAQVHERRLQHHPGSRGVRPRVEEVRQPAAA